MLPRFQVPLKLSALALPVLLAAGWCAAAEHTSDSLDTVKKRVSENKAVLVDVREEAEWKQGHIEGAKLLPLSTLKDAKDADRVKKQLPAEKIIYVHCAAGVRSLRAAEILKQQGFDVRALKPGYKELLKSGFQKAEE